MRWFLMIPLTIGAVTVLQGVLNRQMGNVMGLSSAVLVNAAVVMVFSVALYLMAQQTPDALPEFFRGAFRPGQLTWWMILPGLFGFMIIAGIPLAISKLGAARVFVAMVAAQMLTSMAWDTLVDHKPLSWTRVLGVALAIVSVLLVSYEAEPPTAPEP